MMGTVLQRITDKPVYGSAMSAAASEPSPVHGAAAATRLIVAASLGNALEFYEILVYGYFAVTIAKVFFSLAVLMLMRVARRSPTTIKGFGSPELSWAELDVASAHNVDHHQVTRVTTVESDQQTKKPPAMSQGFSDCRPVSIHPCCC